MAADDGVRDDQVTEQAADPVAAARAKLREAASKENFGRPHELTKAEQIRALHADIAVLRSKGATWDDVAAILNDTVGARPDTIRQAIIAMKKPKKAKKKKVASPTGSKQTEKQISKGETPGSVPGEKQGGHGNLSRQW